MQDEDAVEDHIPAIQFAHVAADVAPINVENVPPLHEEQLDAPVLE